jgi:hypothetical protein
MSSTDTIFSPGKFKVVDLLHPILKQLSWNIAIIKSNNYDVYGYNLIWDRNNRSP